LVIGAGVLIFLALAVFGKVDEVGRAFQRFDWRYLPAILGLSLGNYLVRFVRWQYYLSRLGLRVGRSRSLVVFMAGITMAVTPVKLGEFLKSYLLWAGDGIPVAASAPVVFAERVTDSVAIILLCAAGVGVFGYGWEIAGAMMGIVVLVGVLVIFRRRMVRWFTRQFMRASQAGAEHQATDQVEKAVAEVLRPKMVLTGSAIGTLAWFCECVGLYLVIKGFGGETEVTLFAATFVYAFSTFAGAVALVPGGLGVTEGSIAGLLLGMGMARPAAVSVTMLVRVATLWFGVGLGALFLLLGRKTTRQRPLTPGPE